MPGTRSALRSFEEIEQALRKKKYSPLYLLHGEEDLLIEATVDLIISEALEEHARSFNLDVLYGGEADARDIVSLASAFPMMSERRVVVVKDFDKLVKKDPLVSYFENPLQSTLLVLIAQKPDFRTKAFKSLMGKAAILEFCPLYERDIPDWITRRIRTLGKEVTAEASQLLGAHVGRSLRAIQNEIDKLFIYVGAQRTISPDDVNAVVGVTKKFNIFELQKAIGKKNLGLALEISERMVNAGEYPIGMIIMLTKYFERLWILREMLPQGQSEQQLASIFRVSVVTVRESLEAARRYSDEQIQRGFRVLLDADERLKFSSPDPKLVMTLLLHAMVQPEGTEHFA
jgi:DNA polymerase-3 subunit delta